MTKMKVILNNQSKFKAVHKDSNLDNLVKFQRFFGRLKSKAAISPEEYHRICPTAAATSALYRLPKLHKENVPMRTILCSNFKVVIITNVQPGFPKFSLHYVIIKLQLKILSSFCSVSQI